MSVGLRRLGTGCIPSCNTSLEPYSLIYHAFILWAGERFSELLENDREKVSNEDPSLGEKGRLASKALVEARTNHLLLDVSKVYSDNIFPFLLYFLSSEPWTCVRFSGEIYFRRKL